MTKAEEIQVLIWLYRLMLTTNELLTGKGQREIFSGADKERLMLILDRLDHPEKERPPV